MAIDAHNGFKPQNCLICDAKCTLIKFEKIESIYHKCPVCDFIFKDASSYLTPEEEQNIYDTHNNSIEDSEYVAYFERFIQKSIINFVSDSKRALDFGSGPEPVLAQILERDYGYNVDIYDKYYAPERVYLGKHYDLITATEVIEHLSDPMSYFELFKALLSPNGILAIMTQFHPNDEVRFEHWHYRRDDTHLSFFTPKTMKFIADQVGLEIIYIDAHKNVAFKLKEIY